MAYDFITGSTARIAVTITDIESNARADPGGLILKIRKPDKVLSTWTYGNAAIVRASPGAYYADIALDQVGRYRWRWEATLPNSGVAEGWLDVGKSDVL